MSDHTDAGDRRHDETWVDVASFPTRPYARFVASALEGNGIEARVVGDDGGGMLPHLDVLTGGIRVQVPAEQAEAASAVLGDFDPPANPPTHDGVELGHDPALDVDTPLAARSRAPWRSVLIGVVALALFIVVATAFLQG